MRTKIRVALAATAVCALTVGTAAPAGAQEEPAALGFAVDKTQAQPGALVLGKADAADVAEHCVTDLEEFTGFESRFFLNLANAVEVAFGFTEIFGQDPPVVPENFEQVAAVLYALIALGVAVDPELAEDVLAQTFVMTFADIATQDPVGERGNFDPNTGEGSVIVPDIDPGLWAVAAACVSPSTDETVVQAALSEAAAFLEEEVDLSGFGFSEPFPTADELVSAALTNEDFAALLEEIGPDLLEPIMVPDAFGAVLFCILDADGNCPEEEPPGPPGEPIEPGDGEARPAQPVTAAPSFTG